MGEGPAARLRPRPLRLPGRTGSRTSPTSPGRTASIALDLPGFGASPMPPWEISIPAYGRFLRDFCERLGIDRCSLVGNSMGGFIATELAITEPERVDDLCSSRRPGITWARARREPAAMLARVGRAAAPVAAALPDVGDQAAEDAPGACFQGVFFDPTRCGARCSGRTSSPRCRAPATSTRMTDLWRLRHPRPARGDRGADPDRLGTQRPRRAGARRGLLQEADRRQRGAGDLRPCGHVPQIERPVRFNRLLEDFLAATRPQVSGARGETRSDL